MMQEIFELSVNEIMPPDEEVLKHQGILPGTKIDGVVKKLLVTASDLYMGMAAPMGMIGELPLHDFARIYEGEGLNEKTTPLAEIYPDAKECALFAVTMGDDISRKIDVLFLGNEFAVGCMLDSYASVGADYVAQIIEDHYRRHLQETGKFTESDALVRYSPGYCGWHISGQKKLFAYLKPEKIGIKLRESFLMEPLKSISGVMLSGPKEIHIFENNYPCCEQCIDKSCEDRINKLRLSLN